MIVSFSFSNVKLCCFSVYFEINIFLFFNYYSWSDKSKTFEDLTPGHRDVCFTHQLKFFFTKRLFDFVEA